MKSLVLLVFFLLSASLSAQTAHHLELIEVHSSGSYHRYYLNGQIINASIIKDMTLHIPEAHRYFNKYQRDKVIYSVLFASGFTLFGIEILRAWQIRNIQYNRIIPSLSMLALGMPVKYSSRKNLHKAVLIYNEETLKELERYKLKNQNNEN